MDLWDLVMLMLRRWLVALPLLLLTAAAVAWTAATVKPHHTAEGSVLLLPPTVERGVQPGQSRDLNPWDTHSMTGAMVTLLRSSRLHEQLTAEGYEGTWEAGRDLQFASMINVVVTSPTERQARETVQRLTELVTIDVAVRQDRPELTGGEAVTVVTLAAGENASVVRGNQMRALIVVLFAGGLLTVIITTATDALLRARAAKRAGRPRPVTGHAGAHPAAPDQPTEHSATRSGGDSANAEAAQAAATASSS
jgi:hypothetical protein